MATTAQTIINRTLRLCKVLGAGEAAGASDAQDALSTLNAMLAEWHEAGIRFPDYSFANLTDDISTDDADREALAYQLAVRIAPEYGVSLPPEVALVARQTMFRLRSRYLQVDGPIQSTYY